MRPSQILRIDEWASRIIGLPDMWTSLMFDNAVLVFGRHIESQLKEVDEQFQPVHTLRELLDIPYSDQELRDMTRESLMRLEIDARHPHRSGIVAD